jgi:hypothetical protein
MQLNKDLREFIELLNSGKVEYLVVGAFAVAWHGYPRFTSDIDFLVGTDPVNAAAVIGVLESFGFRSLGIRLDDLSRPGQVVQLGVKPNRIDLITTITGIDFTEAWARRVTGSIDGIPVFFINREDLIRNKEAAGRPKDLGDAAALRDRKPSE